MKKLMLSAVFALGVSALPAAAQSLPNGCNPATQSCDYSAAMNTCYPVMGPGDAFVMSLPATVAALYWFEEYFGWFGWFD